MTKFANFFYSDLCRNVPETQTDACVCFLWQWRDKTVAQCDLNCSAHLWGELKQLLIKTKGKISYETMATQLGDIVSPNTISKWLK